MHENLKVVLLFRNEETYMWSKAITVSYVPDVPVTLTQQ